MQTESERVDRLYELLPALYRIRDADRGQPLRALLQVIAVEVNLLENDIQRLYENWFIETCEDWVVPYIGDLIGYEPVGEAGMPERVSTEASRARNRVLIPRREVANTIRYRRRKGTLALLEAIARDVAGWPAHAVEFRRLLAQTAARDATAATARGRSADVRLSRPLDRLGSPFDDLAHLADIRRIVSRHTPGRFNVPSVGVFVWRLKPYSVTRAPACCVEDVGPNCYTFSVLGNDAPLLNRPLDGLDAVTASPELGVPGYIDRRAFSEPTVVNGEPAVRASGAYYGLLDQPGSLVAQSVVIWAEDWPSKDTAIGGPVPADCVVPADLDRWRYVPRNGEIALDPVRGRIVFPPRQLPRRGVWVSYHYGFSADIGGGEYDRPTRQHESAQLIRVEGKEDLQKALEKWRPYTDDAGNETGHPEQPSHAVIEIADSGVYVMPVNIFLGAGHTLQLRAGQHKRPVLRLLDWQTDLPDNLTVAGLEGSRFTLDGIMIAGRGVQVEAKLATFTVRHSTLVPGWSLGPDCDPQRPAEPSIQLIDSPACVVIEHSIVGSIQVNNDEVTADPIQIRISDSVLDATGSDCDSPECEALGAAGSQRAHAILRVLRSTVIGRVMTHAIELAENSIFFDRVNVARRQIGCVRFCYIAPRSRSPRRFNCQPDLVARAVEAELAASGASAAEIEVAVRTESRRVRPQFNSIRYGNPTYCQLADACAPEILRGADDESEMGVLHDLFQPQRAASLRTRLAEYSPASNDVGIVVVT